jgi:hypothetical protein
MILTEELIREIKQKALYQACMHYTSDFPENYDADQIIEAILDETDKTVILWEPIENYPREEIVEMIDVLASDFYDFSRKWLSNESTK